MTHQLNNICSYQPDASDEENTLFALALTYQAKFDCRLDDAARLARLDYEMAKITNQILDFNISKEEKAKHEKKFEELGDEFDSLVKKIEAGESKYIL